ncbi:hypothetical protein EW146_g379 [Bondarzewia mesenterica]|uniref:Uracil-DNA glycosylase n=1 Tax=Bondarzewia mesenterica TaxID=1095465 RepID=A0A4S4M8R9_9AGAM|nr:hypothetical protein EW146_g379 [Bondarzewia mesenterica]
MSSISCGESSQLRNRGKVEISSPSDINAELAVHQPQDGIELLENASGVDEASSNVTAGAVDIQHVIENLERDTMGASWYSALEPEFEKPYFRKLKKFLVSEHKSQTIYPATRNIYSWSRLTPLDSVKVVVIGQDPYHDANQAHGLAFSVLSPTKPPLSLKNIYRQIKADIPSFSIPSSGDLTPLAKLGVLFLNTCLTVRAHKAHSHAHKGWEELTTAALRAVACRKSEGDGGRGVVFFAWGLAAQKTCAAVGIDEVSTINKLTEVKARDSGYLLVLSKDQASSVTLGSSISAIRL